MVNTWEEFLSKVTAAKTEGLIEKFSVPAMTNLIYGGAVDSLLAEQLKQKNRIQVYNDAYTELKTALKSKAGLPKKTKNSIIGISDIKTDAHLAMWRHSNSPLGVYPFLESLKDNLMMLGFVYNQDRERYQKTEKVGSNNIIHIATDNFSKIFSFYGTGFWNQIESEKYIFHVVGVVTAVSTRLYSNNTKEMLKVSFFTGREMVEDIILWPEYGKNEVNQFWKTSIQVGELFLFRVKPKFDNGNKGGQLKDVKKFQG